MSRTLPYSNCDEDDDIPFSIGSSRFSNTFPKQQEMRTLRDGILRCNYEDIQPMQRIYVLLTKVRNFHQQKTSQQKKDSHIETTF